MLEFFFTKKGYEVLRYSSPEVCPFNNLADSCKDLNLCADLIISDYKMSEMTGTEMLQRQEERGCKVNNKMKAIMSGYNDEEILTVCKDRGYRYFHKPFNLSELTGWLTECEKLFDLSQELSERRLNKREDFKQDVEYCLDPAISQKTFIGIIVNKSDEGLGLHVFNPLRSGDKITVLQGLEAENLNGIVTWCSKQDENIYRTGLRLLNGNSQF